jgi:hypothetical protein
MTHLPQLRHLGVLDGRLLAHQAAYAEFGKELESPSGDGEVVAVAAVGIVVIEDRFEGFGRLGEDPVVADVDPLIGVGGEDFCARSTKGRITEAV